jgi:hypothetical protein
LTDKAFVSEKRDWDTDLDNKKVIEEMYPARCASGISRVEIYPSHFDDSYFVMDHQLKIVIYYGSEDECQSFKDWYLN